MRRGSSRIDGGKVKVNEHGETYVERRGRKPGPKPRKSSSVQPPGVVGVSMRRSYARNSRRSDQNTVAGQVAAIVSKYASRRSEMFKANCPSRAPTARAAIVTNETVWYKNTMYQVGDIVAITDSTDGLCYFAQIRGLITDPLLQHYAALTWLIPKRSALNPHEFEAEHFAHGVVDSKNYPLEVCEWRDSRPPLAPYRREWTLQTATATFGRQRLLERSQQLRSLADEELRKLRQTPIVQMRPNIK